MANILLIITGMIQFYCSLYFTTAVCIFFSTGFLSYNLQRFNIMRLFRGMEWGLLLKRTENIIYRYDIMSIFRSIRRFTAAWRLAPAEEIEYVLV